MSLETILAAVLAVAGPSNCVSYPVAGPPEPCKVTISAKRSGRINGWAMGMHIEISTKAVERLSENELFWLVAHEVGHVYGDHSFTRKKDRRQRALNEWEADCFAAKATKAAGRPQPTLWFLPKGADSEHGSRVARQSYAEQCYARG